MRSTTFLSRDRVYDGDGTYLGEIVYIRQRGTFRGTHYGWRRLGAAPHSRPTSKAAAIAELRALKEIIDARNAP